MFASNLNYVITLLTILVHVVYVHCLPIEVTGPNIKYYKLTPNEGSGNYNFNYGTRDGSQRSERGFVRKEEGSGRPLLTVTGTFKYSDADGELHEVCYIADEQGYRIVSKEELDELHEQLKPTENEIFSDDTVVSSTLKPSDPQLVARSSIEPIPSSVSQSLSSLIPNVSPSHISELRASLFSTLPPTPSTESQIIKLKVIKPPSDKLIVCAPGKCTGERQSKIFKIKSLKIG